jgi:hypothetical protein
MLSVFRVRDVFEGELVGVVVDRVDLVDTVDVMGIWTTRTHTDSHGRGWAGRYLR